MKLGIKYKLFFSMLAGSCALVICMFAFMQWSFDRGFLKYLNRVEAERLDSLAQILEVLYEKESNWDFLRDRPLVWRQILRASRPDNLEESHPFNPDEILHLVETGRRDWFSRPGEKDRPWPPRRPELLKYFGFRVVLLDDGRQSLFGTPDHPDLLPWKKLQVAGRTIGFLGLIPQKDISETHQLQFVKKQKRAFALIALALVGIVALLSLPLAHRMVRRIRQLAEATHHLAAGNLGARVTATTTDELGQLARDFNSLALTLEKNEKARRQWVADISHELRTPLSILRGEIEALQDGVRQPDSGAIRSLHHEVLHLGRLVDDLYQLSLSDLGALTYRKESVDLATVLRQVLEPHRPEFDKKGISLEVAPLPKTPILVFADTERLQQLFANLLDNSAKYTDPGGRLEIRLDVRDNLATIQFQDTPPGVPGGEMDKLFERLYRVEGSRSRATGGAGLGLAICRNIAEAHGGTIDARPSPLGGVWIEVILPREGGMT